MFFTPSSIVQTIVNVIEPDHGTVFDPACGSGGMFVQSSPFIEHEGGDTAKKVVFYGQEKNPSPSALPFGLPGVNKQKKVGNGNGRRTLGFRTERDARAKNHAHV